MFGRVERLATARYSKCNVAKVGRSIAPGHALKIFVQQNRSIGSETLFGIPSLIQASIVGIHSLTDAPWWATIAMSTVIARTSLLPLVRTQMIASQKLATAMPEISFLYQLLIKRLKGIKATNTNERMRILSVFFQGVNACFELHEVSKMQVLAYPFVNIAIFMTFVYSVRDMIVHSGNNELVQGGMLWFADLTTKDSTFLLPMSALSLSYLAMELGFGQNKNQAAMFFKDAFQSLTILSIPLVVGLPSGVFCYWIPSSLFAIAQGQLLRGPYAQRLLNIPPPKIRPEAGKHPLEKDVPKL